MAFYGIYHVGSPDLEFPPNRVLHHCKIDCLPLSARLSPRAWPCCTQLSRFPQLRVDQWIESQLLSRLPPELPPPDWPAPSSPPISLDPCLQVHLQPHSITASKCISEVAWLLPASSHDYGLQVHLQTRSITASKCISKVTRSWPPSASLSSVNHGLQVHLQTGSSTVLKWISRFARLRPPNSLDHDLGVHI